MGERMPAPAHFILQLIPLFIGMLALLITRDELAITGIVVLVVVATFVMRCERNEIWWFVIGVACGVILEIGGDAIYQMQYWQHTSFFTVPLWLPLLWGYFFVIIRRAGNLIVKDGKNEKRMKRK